MRRGVLAAALAVMALAAGHVPSAAAAIPPIKHVFVVILENEDADSTFAPNSRAPYLAQTLRAQGAFIPGFWAIGHLSLDNYIAMVSGQGPNPYTQADAPVFTNFVPGTPAANGQYLGFGAVYPTQVKTIANQLDAKGRTWGGYMEDMANSTTGEPKTCRHPPINGVDHTQDARVGDQYATRHNPYMYFHSIIDDQAKCDARVVDLTRLPNALESTGATPNYTFITPNLCHDGHDEPCVNGEPGGLVSANAFLKKWIPQILASPAYKQDGLLIITFDEAENHDTSACCGEQQGPNTPNNGGPTPGAGGGRIGAVLLSRFIKPGTVTGHAYNHYSMLRSIENMFGLAQLGYAGVDGLRPFGADIFTNPGGTQLPPVKKPTVSLGFNRSLQPCTSTRFVATANATGRETRIAISLDGRRLGVKTSHDLSVRIDVKDLKPGRHVVRAKVTDGFGRSATSSRSFDRCRPGTGTGDDDDDD